MKDPKAPKIDTEKEVENLIDPENLDGVDVGLSDDAVLQIAATERFQMATAYQQLHIRAFTSKASMTANENVGNPKGAEQFKNEYESLEIKKMHCLRGIKEIDKNYPKAKAKMQEMYNKKAEK